VEEVVFLEKFFGELALCFVFFVAFGFGVQNGDGDGGCAGGDGAGVVGRGDEAD
jgi:hypothetical protein